jgi:threonine synthase
MLMAAGAGPAGYASTRPGGGAAATFEEAVFRGFSPGGGLYVPATFPAARDGRYWAARRGWSFQALAIEVLAWFVPPTEIPPGDLAAIVARATSTFADPAITPQRRYTAAGGQQAPTSSPPATLDVLELFHGPSLAFKDVAMQFLLQCLQYFLRRRRARLALLVATTGDTGPAALAAARTVPEVECVVLYTRDRVSARQEWQMLSETAPHLHALSVPATSDELDAVVRRLFRDDAAGLLGTVNSFNWARVLFQAVAYVHACLHHPANAGDAHAAVPLVPVTVFVPSGGAGNVVSALYARWLGLPLTVVACTNENATLPRLLAGDAVPLPVHTVPTLSPCMDISAPSNLERVLYHGWERHRRGEVTDADRGHIAEVMQALAAVDAAHPAGAVARLDPALVAALRPELTTATVTSAETADALAHASDTYGAVLCPHTAVAYAVWQGRADRAGASLVVGTASPTKFYATLAAALAGRGPLPFADVDVETLEALRQSDRCVRAASASDAEALLRAELPVWFARPVP